MVFQPKLLFMEFLQYVCCLLDFGHNFTILGISAMTTIYGILTIFFLFVGFHYNYAFSEISGIAAIYLISAITLICVGFHSYFTELLSTV